MSNLPLQPINWRTFKSIVGVSCDATTPICEYDVWQSDGSWVVEYYNRQTEEPTKIATGFATIDEAKAWAWNHYNEKMQPYINNTQTWIDASKQLPQVDKDTQFICAYDSALEPYVRVTTFSVEMGDFGLDYADVLAWMPIPEFSTMQNSKGGDCESN